MNTKPLLVVLTPVRNEAWVLRAFLEATSLWADYIIIGDQMSADGSREIARKYPKVILIDNNREKMHMAAARRLLFEEAKKIEGDKILFALDADEFLSGDFVNTEDWKKIMDSRPDDSFSWRWMNLKKGDVTKYSTSSHYYWAVHESKVLWEGLFPDNIIHEWRLPWSPVADDTHNYLLNEICTIHLAKVNDLRQRNKDVYYLVSTISCNNKISAVSLFRQYHAADKLTYFEVPNTAYQYYQRRGLDIFKYVDFHDDGQYYIVEVLRFFEQNGVKKYAKLDIWDQNWLKKNGLKDPRNFIQKVLHVYLRLTQRYSTRFLVQGIDKLLKTLGC